MTPMRVGNGIDVHAFSDDAARVLRVLGVAIPDSAGLAGHSDGDVAAHAVADALLGAAALGDLGERFGVDAPALVDADSMRLLADVVADTRDAGWRVANVDVTIVAQRPRLAPHRGMMRANLSRVCDLDLAATSVKFTTTDRLGSVGRGEGIAVWAGCLLTQAHG